MIKSLKRVPLIFIIVIVLISTIASNVYAYTPVLTDNLINNSNYGYCEPETNVTELDFPFTSDSWEVFDFDDETANNYDAGSWCFRIPLSDISVLKFHSSSSSHLLKFYDAAGIEIYSEAFSADDTVFHDVNISQARYAEIINAGELGTFFAALGDGIDEEPDPEPSTEGRALIVITLDNGIEKEYEWSMTQVDDFIDWYDDRAEGTGPARYTVVKEYNQGPFLTRKEYLLFNKIITFEVMEYEVEEE